MTQQQGSAPQNFKYILDTLEKAIDPSLARTGSTPIRETVEIFWEYLVNNPEDYNARSQVLIRRVLCEGYSASDIDRFWIIQHLFLLVEMKRDVSFIPTIKEFILSLNERNSFTGLAQILQYMNLPATYDRIVVDAIARRVVEFLESLPK